MNLTRLNRFKREAPFRWPFVVSLEFPEGLYGFEQERHFELVGYEKEIPFLRLISAGNKKISFRLIDPFVILPDYDPEPHKSDLAALVVEKTEHLFLLALVNLKERTANLSAPLLIDWEKKRGKQLLLPEEPNQLRWDQTFY